MKVRWRQHEVILVTLTAAFLMVSYLWAMYHVTPGQFADPFIHTKTPFNFYKNVFLPDIGNGVLVYLSYLILHFFTVPRLLFPKKFEAGTSKISISFKKIHLQGLATKILKKYTWLIIQIGCIILLLGTVLNIAIYYRYQWLYNYPGFSIFPRIGYNPNSQINIAGSYAVVSVTMALYGLYVCVREVIIHFIERPGGRRAFRVMIINQVTLFLLVYLLFIPVDAELLKIEPGGPLYVMYCSLPSAVFLLFLNIYWFFPSKGRQPFLRTGFVLRLFIITFVCTFPVPFFFGFGVSLPWFLLSWTFELIIVTPFSWLLYQQQKDKILQLRGLEKALVKSKADLQFLRSQINPHFLFNVLNTLYGTALQEKAELTAGGIQQLGDMMRFMLHENMLDFIQMDKETEYLKNYISLQKLRTQSSADIIIEDNIADQSCNHKIAPMLLIPLVENAFKHGISLKEKSWIKINLHCTEKEIIFEVHNSMHEKNENDPEKDRSGIGFKNVLERLKLIYPGRHRISVNGDGKEFFVQLAIQPQD
jgi:two-component system LytT family sensor kinase